jgi:tRNA pseudouridine65 synthase
MLEICYADPYYVAVHKPAGLLVHRSAMAGDRQTLMRLLRDQLGQHVYPVHRLDRGTAGIVLFALSSEAASAIGQDFQAHAVTKRYLAVVRGWLPEAGRIDYDLEKDGTGILQPAITDYRRLATAELPIPVDRYATARYSLAEISPLTGRMHQIRRHFAHLRHPILADRKRGDRHHNRMWEERFQMTDMQLLAWQLEFQHPFDQTAVRIATRPAPEMRRTVEEILGWQFPA